MDLPRVPVLAIVPPPVLYAAVFFVGLGLERLAHFDTNWIRNPVAQWLGWAFLVFGVLIAASSAGLFALRRTTVIPFGRPSEFVAAGAYRFSRNPMYLGLTLAYVGAALALSKLWPLALLPLPWAVMNWIVIPFEESRLLEAFGGTYADYRRQVRRWV
jgi:protein-S-isoprenylcysteine O-methyltransferase Ste14